jgi:L-lysine exporter family protein LysE/ArgO
MLSAMGVGFATGMGLIAAIGAQNGFVLAQGIRRNHHLLIALVCIGCDAVLITAGVGGMGRCIAGEPVLTRWMTWAGAAFLVLYGMRLLWSAVRGGVLSATKGSLLSRKEAVTTTLAITLLNPHVYLDTVVLLGALSSGLIGNNRWWFAVGAVFASTLWFLGLALGGRMLAPLCSRPGAWRIIDILVGTTMWWVAWSLVSRV